MTTYVMFIANLLSQFGCVLKQSACFMDSSIQSGHSVESDMHQGKKMRKPYDT